MVQIKAQSNEIQPTLEFIESIFPGTNLSPIKNIFSNTDITGSLTFNKKLKDEIYTLVVEINK